MLENIRRRDKKLVKILSIVTILSVVCCITMIVVTAHRPGSSEFCTRCHEDDIDRKFNADPQRNDSLSWTVSFRHSQHPEQDFSCKECHSVSYESDAGIVEYNLNCSKCHHISEEKRGCVECHNEPSDYLMGTAMIAGVAPAPDKMSRAVKCEDCHKYNEEGLRFNGVEEYCIECHNSDYGKLFNAWTKTIEDRVEKFNIRVQLLVEDGIRMIDSDMDNEVKEVGQVGMDAYLEKTGKTVDLVSRYGTHNFNLTRTILDSLEEEIRALK